jgi:hypothetical protein
LTLTKASAQFKWLVQDRTVAKVMLPQRRWEWRIIFFLVVCRMLTEEVRLGYG